MEKLKYCKVRNVKSPVRGTSVAAGVDFFVPEDLDREVMDSKCGITGCHPEIEYSESGYLTRIHLHPGESIMIPSGIHLKIRDGYALAFMNKSGVGVKKQLDRLAELVDQDYQGEVHLNLVNNGASEQIISAGDKILQGVLIPVAYDEPEETNSLEELYADSVSERGTGGFGSTGDK